MEFDLGRESPWINLPVPFEMALRVEAFARGERLTWNMAALTLLGLALAAPELWRWRPGLDPPLVPSHDPHRPGSGWRNHNGKEGQAMGRNIGERARRGIPPPPGSPAAWDLGCICPCKRNWELHGAPSNARRELAVVSALCPLHGWKPSPPPAPYRRDEVLAILREAMPILQSRFAIRALWLFEDICRDKANHDSEVFLFASYDTDREHGSFKALTECTEMLEGRLGVRVELGEESTLKDAAREQVMAERIKVE